MTRVRHYSYKVDYVFLNESYPALLTKTVAVHSALVKAVNAEAAKAGVTDTNEHGSDIVFLNAQRHPKSAPKFRPSVKRRLTKAQKALVEGFLDAKHELASLEPLQQASLNVAPVSNDSTPVVIAPTTVVEPTAEVPFVVTTNALWEPVNVTVTFSQPDESPTPSSTEEEPCLFTPDNCPKPECACGAEEDAETSSVIPVNIDWNVLIGVGSGLLVLILFFLVYVLTR